MSEGFQPAFPVSKSDSDMLGGLTKRELFAAMALQGILADPEVKTNGAVASAVQAADLLLAELAK